MLKLEEDPANVTPSYNDRLEAYKKRMYTIITKTEANIIMRHWEEIQIVYDALEKFYPSDTQPEHLRIGKFNKHADAAWEILNKFGLKLNDATIEMVEQIVENG